jgi:hypothetical protein
MYVIARTATKEGKMTGYTAGSRSRSRRAFCVPTAVVIVLHELGALPGSAVLAVHHVVMIPAMLGVMLWRYEH